MKAVAGVILLLLLFAITATLVITMKDKIESIARAPTSTTATTSNNGAGDTNVVKENEYLRIIVPKTTFYENEQIAVEYTILQRPPVPSGYSAVVGIRDASGKWVVGADLITSPTWGQIRYPWIQHYRLTPAFIYEVDNARIFMGLLPGRYNIYGSIYWTDTEPREIKTDPVQITVLPADHLEITSFNVQIDKASRQCIIDISYNMLKADIYVHITWLSQGWNGQVVWDVLYHDVIKLPAGSSGYTIVFTTPYDISGDSTFKVTISHGSDAYYEQVVNA